MASPWAAWTETPTGGASNFITGAGGFLQLLLFGLPGLRLTADALRLQCPTLPVGARTLAVRGLAWRGGRFDLRLAAGTLTVEATFGAGLFSVGAPGTEPAPLARGLGPVAFPLGPGTVLEIREV